MCGLTLLMSTLRITNVFSAFSKGNFPDHIPKLNGRREIFLSNFPNGVIRTKLLACWLACFVVLGDASKAPSAAEQAFYKEPMTSPEVSLK